MKDQEPDDYFACSMCGRFCWVEWFEMDSELRSVCCDRIAELNPKYRQPEIEVT